MAALHAMAILQVFQAKILQSLDGAVETDTVHNFRAATDLALMATKLSAQAIGKSMRFLVVLQRHLWLTLAELKDNERNALLNAPITPAGLFGDAVELESYESAAPQTLIVSGDHHITLYFCPAISASPSEATLGWQHHTRSDRARRKAEGLAVPVPPTTR